VEKDRIIDGSRTRAGDAIIGLASPDRIRTAIRSSASC